MPDSQTFRQIALSFAGASEQPHFHKTSFRVGTKIFATLDAGKNLACLLLSPADQSVFCAYNKSIIFPVPNKWGQQGATFVDLEQIPVEMLADALEQAYRKIAPKTKS